MALSITHVKDKVGELGALTTRLPGSSVVQSVPAELKVKEDFLIHLYCWGNCFPNQLLGSLLLTPPRPLLSCRLWSAPVSAPFLLQVNPASRLCNWQWSSLGTNC